MPLLSNQFPSSLNSQNDLWYSQHCLELSQCGCKACQGWLWTEAPSCLYHPREHTFSLWGQCLSKKYYSRVISFCFIAEYFIFKTNEHQEKACIKIWRQNSLCSIESPVVLFLWWNCFVFSNWSGDFFLGPNRVYPKRLDAILPNYAIWMHLNLINWSQVVLVVFTWTF